MGTAGKLPQFSNAKTLANKFNGFYSNKVLQIRNKIKPSNLAQDFRQTFNGMIMDSFAPTTVDELRGILKKMGIKTSCQDPLPGSLLTSTITRTRTTTSTITRTSTSTNTKTNTQ